MSFDSVEDDLTTMIKILAGYDGNNVSQGDFRILGHGKSSAIVTTPGSVTPPRFVGAQRRVAFDWEVLLDLFILFKSDVSVIASDIRTIRTTLINHLLAYPTLNGGTGVVRSAIGVIEEPDHWQMGNHMYWRQRFHFTIEERANIAIAE